MNKVDFDQYAQDYNRILNEKTAFFTDDEAYFARYKVDIVRRACGGAAARILEFGCGIGRNIPFLREAFPGSEIVGSDVSAESIRMAQEHNPGVRFLLDDGSEKLFEESEKFDLIFVAGVFHHIAPPLREEVTRQLVGRLKVTGSVFVFEHNPYNPVTRRIVNDCPYDEDAVLLRPAEMMGLCRQAGLGAIEHGYSLFFPPKLKFLTAAERLMGWLPLGGQYWVHGRRA